MNVEDIFFFGFLGKYGIEFCIRCEIILELDYVASILWVEFKYIKVKHISREKKVFRLKKSC